MSRKNKPVAGLGRSLIKDRFGNTKGRRGGEISMLHTTEIDDGFDWGRLNLQSVTEESSFQEFLSTAELADTEFQAEKLNVTFVNPLANVGLLSQEERSAIEKSHSEHEGHLRIPRRPKWTETTTAEELDALEKEGFLEWRRSLALLQESKGLLLTPYEKNLEFWRQLWRVVERSDVIAQIVDARNPLLFRCKDLEAYTKEMSPHKDNLILINKADFLTEKQRQHWADYFTSVSVRVVFFSATLAAEEDNNQTPSAESSEDHSSETDSEGEEICRKMTHPEQGLSGNHLKQDDLPTEPEIPVKSQSKETTHEIEQSNPILNSGKLLSRKDLISFLKTVHNGKRVTQDVVTIGLVGYPNVGKSSTINSLMAEKKVSVSATPGKTKHFQTLYLDDDILLCDCPGLVMPSFVSTRAEMVLNGILPIDNLRDHVEPVNLLCSYIPRHILEDNYGIMIPPPLEGEDPSRPPTSQELLNSYGFNRGFMTHKGLPDNPRSARIILKDFVNGKLLYCVAPPLIEQSEYHSFPPRQRQTKQSSKGVTPQSAKIMRPNKQTSEDLDSAFFLKASLGAHSKGRKLIPTGNKTSDPNERSHKKHDKRNKKEKLRRLFGHLDA